jgi:hypothetical protein
VALETCPFPAEGAAGRQQRSVPKPAVVGAVCHRTGLTEKRASSRLLRALQRRSRYLHGHEPELPTADFIVIGPIGMALRQWSACTGTVSMLVPAMGAKTSQHYITVNTPKHRP